MLVLTRRVGEAIVLSGGIRIVLVAVKSGMARLGIVAPPLVEVDREEVWSRQYSQTVDQRNKTRGDPRCQGKRRTFHSADPLADQIEKLLTESHGMPPRRAIVSDVELDAAEQELSVAFPPTYRAFLRGFESRSLPGGLFGLPRDHMRSDIVLMNHMELDRPVHFVKFYEDPERRFYYFDTTRIDARGDCPIVIRDRTKSESEVAAGFLDFLAGTGIGATG